MNKAVIIRMDKLDEINNRIILSFNDRELDLLESNNKTYAFRFYIDNGIYEGKFILHPFKIDYKKKLRALQLEV